jgi:hypothetical protein
MSSSTKNQSNVKKSVKSEKNDEFETSDEDNNENNNEKSLSHEDNAMSIGTNCPLPNF